MCQIDSSDQALPFTIPENLNGPECHGKNIAAF